MFQTKILNRKKITKAQKLAATAQYLQARRPVARPEPPLAFHARSTGSYHNFYASH